MNIRSYLIPVILSLAIGISVYGSDTITIDLKTAKPEQITPFLQPQYIQALAEQTLNDGLANIPIANLKALFDYPELAKEIITQLNDTKQITEQNATLLAKPAARNLTTLNTNVLQKILAIQQVLFLKKVARSAQVFYPFNDLLQKLTQTKKHLIAHFADKYKYARSNGGLNYQDDIQLQAMTKRVLDLEYQEQQKGRYTFVHGHQWHHHFYQEIYTDLWSIANGPIGNYRFIRYKTPDMTDKKSFAKEIKDESDIREKWINDHTIDEHKAGKTRLLFMNYSLFANYYGESSAAYIKDNRSIKDWTIDCINFIKQLKLDHYFSHDELTSICAQLKELSTEHKTLNSYGGGLLLSFTPEALIKSVYPGQPYGYRQSITIDGYGKTDNIKTILDTLQTSPEKIKNSDKIPFVCVLSYDCALMPNNGVDIYEFNAADQEKLAAWRTKKNELMAWIKDRVAERLNSFALISFKEITHEH